MLELYYDFLYFKLTIFAFLKMNAFISLFNNAIYENRYKYISCVELISQTLLY